MSITQEIKESFRENDITIKLLYINAAVFIILRLADIVAMGGGAMRGWMLEWVAMPIGSGVLTRPWTLITNIVAHYDLIHFIFNMFAIYWIGHGIFMRIYGDEGRALKTYVLGGIAGSVASFLLNVVSHSHGILLGASGAIMALMTASAVAAPNMTIWMPFLRDVRLKYIALTYILLDIILFIDMSNAGGHLAHLGGALMGVLLAKQWSRVPKQTSESTLGAILGRKPKMKVVHSENPDWTYNKKKADTNREVDRILDKIKASGYDSLTAAEKQTLFDQKG